ncbi:MAG: amidohydrolase family protein [Bacteroidia bacterium]|nr:amidohydrolase family protein [Bacteroidia bacterium]
MNSFICKSLILILFSFNILQGYAQQTADMVMINGNILTVNLRPPEVTTIEGIKIKIAEKVAIIEPGEWITGDGFALVGGDRMPNKWDLDEVSPDNPVILNSMGGHFGVANSYALDIAGITDTTPNPGGGIQFTTGITENSLHKQNSLFELLPAMPNPFNNTSEIRFRVHESNTGEPLHLNLSLYNIMGEKVRQLAKGNYRPGDYRVSWDGTNDQGEKLTIGIYLIKLTGAGNTVLDKIVLAY